MGVRSTVFGAVRLSGEESKKFVSQVVHGLPKQAAKVSYAEGKSLATQVSTQGFAEVKVDKVA